MPIKAVPLSEIPDKAMLMWVCGSRFPSESDPRHKDAVWGKCDTCLTPVVHSKDAPEEATKLCQTCAHLMHSGIGEEDAEYVMTPEAKKQVDEIYGPGMADRFHDECIRRLKEGK